MLGNRSFRQLRQIRLMKISKSCVYENVVEDVINNVLDEFIIYGSGADVLKELRGVWKTKMKQHGVLDGSINNSGGPITLVRDLNVPYDSTEDHETPKSKILFPPTIFGRPVNNMDGRHRVDTSICQQSRTQNFLTVSWGKRKREDSASPPKRFIPQQDGAGDVFLCIFEIEVGETSTLHKRCGMLASKNRTNSLFKPKSSLRRITQEDGLMPDPYVDVLSTPKIYNYHGGFNEGFMTANTPAPNDLLSTPALPSENGIADDDDFNGVGRGEDQNVQRLALTQVDQATLSL